MDTEIIDVRSLTIEDYQELKESMIQAYASLGGQYWKEEAIKKPVSYTHLRAHETVLDLVCRLLLEKKKNTNIHT